MGQKIVINVCFGGFGISKKAYEFLGLEWDSYGYAFAGSRADPKLVECVETLGDEASGDFADLKVVEIPDGVEWTIEEYDGTEWVAEAHRTWK
jgi:hypothetical protein